MNRKKCFKLSLINLICALVMFAISYITFHYVNDYGFTSIKQEEAGKPFVTDMMGQLGVLFFFAAITFLIIALVVYKKDKESRN